MTETSGCVAGGVLKVIDGALVCVSQVIPCPAVPDNAAVLFFIGALFGFVATGLVLILLGEKR